MTQETRRKAGEHTNKSSACDDHPLLDCATDFLWLEQVVRNPSLTRSDCARHKYGARNGCVFSFAQTARSLHPFYILVDTLHTKCLLFLCTAQEEVE